MKAVRKAYFPWAGDQERFPEDLIFKLRPGG